MAAFTYILFSESLSRFYVGYTSGNVQDRLRKHLLNHKGYTGKAKDWVLLFSQKSESISEAIALEKKIKKRGAKRFLLDQGLF